LFRYAADHGILDALPAARQIAGNKDRPLHLRLAALATIARLGDRTSLALFTPFFDDRTVISTEGGLSAQVRDVAVGYALRSQGRDPGTLGFAAGLGTDAAAFEYARFGFRDDTVRNDSHAKARNLLDTLVK
jgi:hypothetical protein